MTLNNKKTGPHIQTNKSFSPIIFTSIYGRSSYSAIWKSQRLPQISVQGKYFWKINVSTLPTILLSAFGPMLSRLINCATF